ncbi:hypothetical protein [Achromobacter insolitus]|uniref:hypothetical protein n=1 Tax=Achromobacter insolitus TaxID=217204 RepID=UPI002FDCBC11
MKAKPAIAVLRRQQATEKFKRKLEVLERLLNDGTLGQFPQRVSITSFANWADAQLGVLPVSRSIIYDVAEEYVQLRTKMEHLLHRVSQARARTSKRGSIEAELRRKLEVAEAKAQDYVNQYTSSRAELLEARQEIERLNTKLRRQIAENGRVTPLQLVSTDLKDSE